MEKTLNIGDFVKYRTHRGQIIDIRDPWECPYTGIQAGSVTMITEDGYQFMDYDYVFELDREKMREWKLKKLGI